MGAVYEAIQEPIERRVALKVLLPQHAQNRDALERFFNEARAVNRIEHPGIVQVSDYGQAPDGTAFLVMEYLRGETLESRLAGLLREGQRLQWLEVAQIAAQLADALSAAHDKAIVHRDLKPGNVMLVQDAVAPGGERAKILDFGIAKLTPGKGQGTATHALIGTPPYMSPEQCRGAGGVDAKTDVYALGVMLYEMVAGRTPFLGENTIDYLGQHSFKEPPALYDFAAHAHPPLVALIHRLLVKDKAVRPDMREVGRELSRLISSVSGARAALALAVVDEDATFVKLDRVAPVLPLSPLSTLSGSLGQTQQPSPPRHRWLRIVGAAAIGVVAAGVMVLVLGAVLLRRPVAGRAAQSVVPGPVVPVVVPETVHAVSTPSLPPAVVPPAPAVERPAPAAAPSADVPPQPVVNAMGTVPPPAKPVVGTKPATPPTTPAAAVSELAKGSKVAVPVGPVPAATAPAKPSPVVGPVSKPKTAGPVSKGGVRYED